MKNFSPKKLLIQFFLFSLIPFSVTFAQSGCYVRDGGRELYTSATGQFLNICGGNVRVYTLNSAAPRVANCPWKPVSPAGNYNCVVMPGGFCGIEGIFVLECSLDHLVWALIILLTGLSFYILRRYPQT